ncbi:MAG: hypothetical protein HY696_06110 [Deltaproteobacteria bacterium]|nr:hypothetical protein [Deltaproteobacteria bacterium]
MSEKPMPGSSGLAPNIASLLCYLLMFLSCGFPVAGIVFVVIEKQEPVVRFHAWQSILLGGVAWVVMMGLWFIGELAGRVVGIFGTFFDFVRGVVGLSILSIWIICLIKAYQFETWKIPFIGEYAAKQAHSEGT